MIAYIVDLYHRAIGNKKLTAHERAGLKAVQGAVIGFFVALVPQLLLVITGHGTFNLTQGAINTLLTALALAILKLWAAQSDTHLGDVIDAYSTQLQQQAIAGIVTPTEGVIPVLNIAVPLVHATASVKVVPTPGAELPPVIATVSQFVAAPGVPLANRPTGPLPTPQPTASDQPTPGFGHDASTDGSLLVQGKEGVQS